MVVVHQWSQITEKEKNCNSCSNCGLTISTGFKLRSNAECPGTKEIDQAVLNCVKNGQLTLYLKQGYAPFRPFTWPERLCGPVNLEQQFTIKRINNVEGVHMVNDGNVTVWTDGSVYYILGDHDHERLGRQSRNPCEGAVIFT